MRPVRPSQPAFRDPSGVLVVGRSLFALGVIGLGITHFMFRRFATGRAPAWPASLSGGTAWAYVSGAVVIAMGIAMLAGRQVRIVATITALLIFAWALLRHLPLVLAAPFLGAPWTPAGKALVFTSGALAMAATFPLVRTDRDTMLLRFVNARDPFIAGARVSLGIFLTISGAQHFLFTPFVASLIPPWFPGDPVFWSRFAGVALLALGAGLLIPRTARLAAFLSGAMIHSWFWIVHIPRTFTSPSDTIAVCEALAFSGLAFAVAATSSEQTRMPT